MNIEETRKVLWLKSNHRPFREQEIDQLVYQLYELTEEEIKIMEGKG